MGEKIPQPKEKRIRIDVPEQVIIDEDTFKAAQNRARRNMEKAKCIRK